MYDLPDNIESLREDLLYEQIEETHDIRSSCGPYGTRCDMKHTTKVVLCDTCKQTPSWCICDNYRDGTAMYGNHAIV